MTEELTEEQTEERSGPPGADADELEEIEAERTRRLAPENRPEGAVVDNSDVELPAVDAWHAEHDNDDPTGSSSDPSQRFRDNPPSEEEQEEIARVRAERLDPANRPDNVEVDNTGRTFEDGEFKD